MRYNPQEHGLILDHFSVFCECMERNFGRNLKDLFRADVVGTPLFGFLGWG
jgi:hypothetical protein